MSLSFRQRAFIQARLELDQYPPHPSIDRTELQTCSQLPSAFSPAAFFKKPADEVKNNNNQKRERG